LKCETQEQIQKELIKSDNFELTQFKEVAIEVIQCKNIYDEFSLELLPFDLFLRERLARIVNVQNSVNFDVIFRLQ